MIHQNPQQNIKSIIKWKRNILKTRSQYLFEAEEGGFDNSGAGAGSFSSLDLVPERKA